MNVRVNLNYPIYDGAEIVFKAPCDASEVTGLIVYYPSGTEVVSSVFAFADAHANDLGDLDDLFAKGAVVKVILDTETDMAFVQNAATNAYLERRFAGMGGGGGSVDLSNYYTKDETAQKISNYMSPVLPTLQTHDERITALDGAVGDISTALDSIIAIQGELIGGDTE